MPRRFALALLCILVLILVALLLARRMRPRRAALRATPVPAARPTPLVPPTPIPPRRVALYFESLEDERFHPEARDIASSADAVTFLRSIASAVLDGPKRPELLRPFPDGWKVRAAFRLKDGLAVLDLAPPPPPTPAEGTPPGPPARWQTGTHEEEGAAQALVLSVTRNAPEVTHVVLLVGGEPVDTLAGHVDLTHPLKADPTRAADEPPLEPPPPTPTPAEPTAVPSETPSPTASPAPGASRTPKAKAPAQPGDSV